MNRKIFNDLFSGASKLHRANLYSEIKKINDGNRSVWDIVHGYPELTKDTEKYFTELHKTGDYMKVSSITADADAVHKIKEYCKANGLKIYVLVSKILVKWVNENINDSDNGN